MYMPIWMTALVHEVVEGFTRGVRREQVRDSIAERMLSETNRLQRRTVYHTTEKWAAQLEVI